MKTIDNEIEDLWSSVPKRFQSQIFKFTNAQQVLLQRIAIYEPVELLCQCEAQVL